MSCTSAPLKGMENLIKSVCKNPPKRGGGAEKYREVPYSPDEDSSFLFPLRLLVPIEVYQSAPGSKQNSKIFSYITQLRYRYLPTINNMDFCEKSTKIYDKKNV
jgi:hypothetical protein